MSNCKLLCAVDRAVHANSVLSATGNNTMTGTTSSAVFGYDPSMPMAWIGGVIFTLSALVHVFQYFKHHAWFLYLLMLGIFMEVFGYWTRVIAIRNPNNNAAVFMTFLLTTYVSDLV